MNQLLYFDDAPDSLDQFSPIESSIDFPSATLLRPSYHSSVQDAGVTRSVQKKESESECEVTAICARVIDLPLPMPFLR